LNANSHIEHWKNSRCSLLGLRYGSFAIPKVYCQMAVSAIAEKSKLHHYQRPLGFA